MPVIQICPLFISLVTVNKDLKYLSFQFEAEIEILQTAKKKKNKNENSDKIEEYNVLLEKHRDHVQKLETILRMIDNKTVEISQVNYCCRR